MYRVSVRVKRWMCVSGECVRGGGGCVYYNQ